MSRIRLATGLCAALMLSACASQPLGPTARVMPAPGKPFEVFAQDQALCKQFADAETDSDAIMSNVKQFGTAVVSTALGAGLGAAVRGGRGAQAGGALGGIAGSSMAARGTAHDQNTIQGRYDLAYTQCMFARGNQIGGMARAAQIPGPGYPRGLMAPGMPVIR
ncbi:MAG: glycine zipper family protein [Acetobacteraceae bacterium]|nr:glycine zipper family protein [Acetobacteraceae bacterium]